MELQPKDSRRRQKTSPSHHQKKKKLTEVSFDFLLEIRVYSKNFSNPLWILLIFLFCCFSRRPLTTTEYFLPILSCTEALCYSAWFVGTTWFKAWAETTACAQQGWRFRLLFLLGVALNGFYWRVINILRGVIGPESRDSVGSVITARLTTVKLITLPWKRKPCPQNLFVLRGNCSGLSSHVYKNSHRLIQVCWSEKTLINLCTKQLGYGGVNLTNCMDAVLPRIHIGWNR